MRAEQRAIVLDILRTHAAAYEVWAFGSRARADGRVKPYSDLDLAIITDTPLTIAQGAALADAFEYSDLPWRVDVVDWACVDTAFRSIIERDKIVLQKAVTSSP